MAATKSRGFIFSIIDGIYFIIFPIILTWIFSNDYEKAFNVIKFLSLPSIPYEFFDYVAKSSSGPPKHQFLTFWNDVGISGCVVIIFYIF